MYSDVLPPTSFQPPPSSNINSGSVLLSFSIPSRHMSYVRVVVGKVRIDALIRALAALRT